MSDNETGSMPRTLVHVLSIREGEADGSRTAIVGVRMGAVSPGDALRYRDGSGDLHTVEVVDVQERRRNVELQLRGGVGELSAGRFLFRLPDER